MKIYKRPVCVIEDILHLEMMIGSVNANSLLFLKKKKRKEKKKLLTGYLKKFSGIKDFAKNSTMKLTIS